VTFTRRVPRDREQYINECCVGGDVVVDRFWEGKDPIGRRVTFDFVPDEQPREIGIRMALGAGGMRVMRLVILIANGLVLGLAGAMGVTRFLESELFEVSPTDPTTFTVVTIGVTLVADYHRRAAAVLCALGQRGSATRRNLPTCSV
jgi:hypothetical protein